MPAKFITRESWSRCETPSMLYDAVRHPNTVQKTSLPKDSIETTKRLKQERINKLESKGLELSHESYVTVVQVGKYMFFTVMLPVYLCCYGIPRWLIINALQPLFEGVKNQAANVGRYMVEMTKEITDRMKGLIEQMIGDALRMSKERGKNLFRQVFRKFRNASDKFSDAFKTLKKRTKEIKDSAAKRSQKLYKEAEGRVLQRNAIMKQKTFDNAKRMAALGLRILKKVDEFFLTPLMRLISLPFKFLAYILKAITTFLRRILKAVKAWLKKIIEPKVVFLQKVITAFASKCKKAFQTITQPIVKQVLAIKVHLTAYFQKVHKSLIKPMKAIAAKALGKNKALVHTFIREVKNAMNAFFMPLKPNVKRIKEKAEKRKQKLSQVKNNIKQFTKRLALIIQSGQRWAKKRGEQLYSIINFCGRALKSLVQALAFVPKGMMRYTVTGIKILALIVLRSVFTAQVVATVIKLAFTGGFQLVKETVESHEKG